jgi:hypothetical protein
MMLSIWYLLIDTAIYMSFPRWAIALLMPRLIESALPLLGYSTIRLASPCLAITAHSVKTS